LLKRDIDTFPLICFFEGKPKKISSRKSKVLGANRNLLAFPKDYHFTIDTQNTFPQFWNCFFGIRNGSFSDELHEFGKVLNPKMTDAFYQKHLYSPVWVRKCLPKCKGQVVVWETNNIKGSSDLYGVEFPNTIHKISRITKIPSY
jgi:diphosphomevalonate decarboxylase